MYQMLIVKDWNYLATPEKKPAQMCRDTKVKNYWLKFIKMLVPVFNLCFFGKLVETRNWRGEVEEEVDQGENYFMMNIVFP